MKQPFKGEGNVRHVGLVGHFVLQILECSLLFANYSWFTEVPIIPDSQRCLLFMKLCAHNWLMPTQYTKNIITNTYTLTISNNNICCQILSIPIYIRTCMCAYVRVYLHTYIHTYIRMYIHTYIHTYLHTYVHTYIHKYIHTYIHTYIRTYIHTYIHTYFC